MQIDEKAFEAIRLTLEWDERRGYLMPYTVRDKLRLAYESAKQKGEAEGWVLVPKEPTEPMIEAHFHAHATAMTVFADVPDVWRAMLAAAPEPPMLSAGGEG